MAYSLLIAITLTVAGVAPASAVLLHEKDTTCACKNFKQLHQSGDVTCKNGPGMMQENVTINASEPLYWYQIYFNDSGNELFCERFRDNFDFHDCINMHMGKDAGTWCFVDSTCKNLNEGSRINDQVSWKKCTKKDPMLRDYKLEQLYKLSQTLNIEFGAFLKFAYPGSRAGERQILPADDVKDTIPTWVSQQIKEFGHEDKPYWFDTNQNASLPIFVFHGKQVYKMDFPPPTLTTLDCVMGC